MLGVTGPGSLYIVSVSSRLTAYIYSIFQSTPITIIMYSYMHWNKLIIILERRGWSLEIWTILDFAIKSNETSHHHSKKTNLTIIIIIIIRKKTIHYLATVNFLLIRQSFTSLGFFLTFHLAELKLEITNKHHNTTSTTS